MMNYNYGLGIPQVGGGSDLIDFSPPLCAGCPGGRGAIPADLDETQLDETLVLDPNDTENMLQFRDLLAVSKFWPLNGQDIDGDSNPDVDWTGNGLISIAAFPSTSTRTGNASSREATTRRIPLPPWTTSC